MIERGGTRRERREYLELDASETPVMALERLEAFPGGNIPHHHLPIATGANDVVALESNGVHWTLMSFKGGEEFKGISIPDTNEGVFRTADDMPIVNAKIEDTSGVSVEGGGNLGSASISIQSPYNDGTVATSGNHETRGERIVDIPILIKFQAEDATSMALERSHLSPSFQ